jgi:beta-xylosidase
VGDEFHLQMLTCKAADKNNPESCTDIATLKPTQHDTTSYQPAIYIDIYLRMKVSDGKCQFAYSLDNKRYHDVGALFTMREGKWIGAKMGLLAESKNRKATKGWLDVDWFRVTK